MLLTAEHTPESATCLPPMVVVDMVWPNQSNHHGALFGGAALSMLDRLAFMLASKALRGPVVTAAISKLDFHAPAPAGHLVESQAQIIRRGRRSLTLHTRLIAEDLLSGKRTECLSGEFIMVRQAGEAAAGTPGAPPLATELDIGDDDNTFAQTMVAKIVFPGHANHRGILHGGPAMSWMTEAGFVAATRQVRRTLVIAGTDRMDFKAPASVGDVVEAVARVVSIGRRSVRVQADLWAESPESGERRLCTSGMLVFVAVEEDQGSPDSHAPA